MPNITPLLANKPQPLRGVNVDLTSVQVEVIMSLIQHGIRGGQWYSEDAFALQDELSYYFGNVEDVDIFGYDDDFEGFTHIKEVPTTYFPVERPVDIKSFLDSSLNGYSVVIDEVNTGVDGSTDDEIPASCSNCLCGDC